jgi:hypothetical protein
MVRQIQNNTAKNQKPSSHHKTGVNYQFQTKSYMIPVNRQHASGHANNLPIRN